MWIFSRKINSEKELIEKIKVDKDYFKELYKRYLDKTYNFVYSKVQDKQIAEDLVSDSWFKIVKKIDNFKPSEDYQVSVWIFKIVRNNMFDYFKKNKNVILEKSEEILNFIEDDRVNLNKNIENEFVREIIFEELKNLSKQEREIINLKYYSDLKNNEISKLLNIKEKSVSWALSKGLKKLEILLEWKIYL